jgi:hypothetical protein
MVANLGPYPDLSDFYDFLAFSGLPFLLSLLILIFPIIKKTAYWRCCCSSYLNQSRLRFFAVSSA